MKAEQFFSRNPVFTLKEFEAIRDDGDESHPRSPRALIDYHVRQGRLVRIRRELYAVVPVGSDPETFPIDPYIVATKLADDATIAYHTALELHGLSYSSTERIIYVTQHHTRKFDFRSLHYRSVMVPKSLREANRPDVGITQVDRSGVDVPVTTLERTLVDVLDRPNLGGGWEEVWRSLETVTHIDIASVVEYALLLNNKTTIAKVGFFLQQHQEELWVDNKQLHRLRDHAPIQPHYLRGSRGSPNKFLKEWNLVVPSTLVERSWEENL